MQRTFRARSSHVEVRGKDGSMVGPMDGAVVALLVITLALALGVLVAVVRGRKHVR